MVLIRALPPEAVLWAAVRETEEKALTAVERIRARAAYYEQRAKEAE